MAARTVPGRILLTGVTGQVGGELLPVLSALGEVVAVGSRELDLSKPDLIRDLVREVAPRWIVNPAAYTAVDRAESEPELAELVNGVAPGVLGEEAARLGATVIHFSTDYVFPGHGNTPWRETDEPGPLGVYGATKLTGERALATSGAAHLIFRTSWVYGPTGKNFLGTILRAAGERPELRIVADQHGAPTWARNLAALTAHAIKVVEARSEGGNPAGGVRELGGVYHAADAGETTWFGFAEQFLAIARQREPQRAWATLTPIRTDEYPTPARRPLNSRMDCSRLQCDLGFTMPDWRESVERVMREVGN